MTALIRPCADWLRGHTALLNCTRVRRDVQYAVVSEDDLASELKDSGVVLLEDRQVCQDAEHQTLVFLYNLHMERLSSFEDKVVPALAVTFKVFLPGSVATAAVLSSPDASVPAGTVVFTATTTETGTWVQCAIPPFETAVMVVVETANIP